MTKITKHLWKVENPSNLKQYQAKDGECIFWIWADSMETAVIKAKDWRKNAIVDQRE